MSRRTLVAATGAGVFALAVGYGLGRLLLGAGGRSGRAATPIASTVTNRAPTGSIKSAPPVTEGQAGSVRSPVAAVKTAVNYLAALQARPAGTGPQQAIRALTSGQLTVRALGVQRSAVLLERRIEAGGPAFMRGWPLGYRILSATDHRVEVAVWTMGLVASRAELVSPQWSTTVCTVQWLRGEWRVVAARTAPGPTPPAAGSSPGAVDAFVAGALAFRGFSDAP